MIGLLILLAIIGVIAYVLVTFLPMPSQIKTVIIVVAVVCAILVAWNAFGRPGNDIAVPQIR